jgi:hypothetical protein
MDATLDPLYASAAAESHTVVLRYLTPSPATFRNYQTCPWAKSIVYLHPETGQKTLAALTCKRWGCSYCAPRRIKKLAYLTKGAAPNRWIRLGVQPDLYESPEEAWRKTSPLVPECFRKLKKTYGEIEYLRVCELHNGTTKYDELREPGKALGYPHYHALLRSGYIPQKALSDTWGALTEAPVVWIAKIAESFSSFRYLTKYLTKLHRLEWTDRHVSYSRNFFKPEDMEKLVQPQKDLVAKSDDHPFVYLTNRYGEQEVAVNNDGTYTLPAREDEYQSECRPEHFGLGLPETPPPVTPPSPARLLFDCDDQPTSYYDTDF